MKTLAFNESIPRPIICWGAGEYGQAFANIASLFGICPNFWVDSNPSLQGGSIAFKRFVHDDTMIPIISPDELLTFAKKDCSVIVTMMLFGDTIKTLENAGFTNIFVLPNIIALETNEFLRDYRNKGMAEIIRGKLADTRSREVFDAVTQFRYSGNSDNALMADIEEPNQYFQPFISHNPGEEVFVDGG